MIVYRICKEEEFKNIMENNSFDDVGRICTDSSKLSNHKYEPNKKYLHFFKDYDNIFYLSTSPKHYICTYDIPNELLEKNSGMGYYLDRLSMKRIECVTEYAIPSEDMKLEYLQKVEKITNYIDFEDFIHNEHCDKLETVYDSNAALKKIRTPEKR